MNLNRLGSLVAVVSGSLCAAYSGVWGTLQPVAIVYGAMLILMGLVLAYGEVRP